MAEREYEVVEPMRTCNIFVVTARSRAEAIEKVHRDEHAYVVMGDVAPIRPLTIRDARLIRAAEPRP